MIQDVADINGVHLAAQTFVGSIDAYQAAVAAEAGMRVDAVFSSANVHAALVF